MKTQEEERNNDKKVLTSKIYPDHFINKKNDQNDQQDISLQNQNSISSIYLQNEEQDEDQPDEKLSDQLMVTKEALRKMREVMKVIEPIIHDIKEGSLVRKYPSTYRFKTDSREMFFG